VAIVGAGEIHTRAGEISFAIAKIRDHLPSSKLVEQFKQTWTIIFEFPLILRLFKVISI